MAQQQSKNKKNTLLTEQSTAPFQNRIPPKNPIFQLGGKPSFNNPKFMPQAFRQNQNRGSGGK